MKAHPAVAHRLAPLVFRAPTAPCPLVTWPGAVHLQVECCCGGVSSQSARLGPPFWAPRERASVVAKNLLPGGRGFARPGLDPTRMATLGEGLEERHPAAISCSGAWTGGCYAWTPAITHPLCVPVGLWAPHILIFMTETECSSGEGRQWGWIRTSGTPVQAPGCDCTCFLGPPAIAARGPRGCFGLLPCPPGHFSMPRTP